MSMSGEHRGFPDLGVPVKRGRGREQLDHQLGSVSEGFSDGLRTFQQKKPGLGPGVSLGQLGDRAHTG